MTKLINSFFKAPYRGLPWLVLGYILLCHAALRHGGVFTGHLFGFDDHVRMTQVLNWVNGADFYDLTIHRANPPEGFTSIWSRIVDVPIALVILVAQNFVPQRTAALVAAVVIPVCETAILFNVAPYFVRPLVGKQHARLIVLFLLFTSLLNPKYFSASGFMLGAASHHPWYVILYLSLFGACARIVMGSAALSPILILAGSVTLISAVGIEGYPMIAGVTAILGLVALFSSRPLVAARGALALLCAAVGAFLMLPLFQPPQTLFTVSFTEPSILGVLLIATAGLFLKAEHLLLKKMPTHRIGVGSLLAVAAIVAGGVFAYAFPELKNGAAAGLSPAERAMALRAHFEAQPIHKLGDNLTETVCLLMSSVLALAAGLFAVKKSRGRRRAVNFCFFGFAFLGTGMSELYARYYHHAQTTACAWLLWIWGRLTQRLRRDVNYGLASLGIFIFVGPLWMLIVPDVVNNTPLGVGVLLFPAYTNVLQDPCDALPVGSYINDHFPKDTLLIVPFWLSSAFLYYSDVRIDFVANYPSHDKFIDNFAFFGPQENGQAKAIARSHGIDLVAICAVPKSYDPGLPPSQQTLVAQLQSGLVPDWLHQISTPGFRSNYYLFAVDKAALQN